MKGKANTRTILAFGITLASLIGITVLAALTIALESADQAAADKVLAAVLPLFGTWVGTVLAYYFSRENFEAAADKTESLIRQLTPEERLRATKVTDVMVRKVYSVKDKDRKVAKVLAELTEAGYQRLPILDKADVLEALIYDDGLENYLAGVPEPEKPNKTIRDLLKDPSTLTQTPAFISREGSLADAIRAMQQVKDCKVVFVTEGGAANEPVLGMLTRTDIIKHARP